MPDNLCRVPGGNAISGYGINHYCSSANDAVFTDGNPFADDSAVSDPDVISDINRI